MIEPASTNRVEETATAWEPPPAPAPVRARPRGDDFSVVQAGEETLRRFPKIMARLAE